MGVHLCLMLLIFNIGKCAWLISDMWLVIVEGFTPPVIPQTPSTKGEVLVKANAKAKNLLYGSMTKDVFNMIYSGVTCHDIWTTLELIHEGSRNVRNDCYDRLIS